MNMFTLLRKVPKIKIFLLRFVVTLCCAICCHIFVWWWLMHTEIFPEILIGGSRGGREGRTPPPLGVQILSISCSFRENLACSRPPWRVHAPPSGKSWIRHWFCYKIINVLSNLPRVLFLYSKITKNVPFDEAELPARCLSLKSSISGENKKQPFPSCCSLYGNKNIYFAKGKLPKKTQKTIALRYDLFIYFVEKKLTYMSTHIDEEKYFGLPQTLSEKAQRNLLLEKLSENLKEFIFLDPGENQCVSSGGSRISRG